MSTKRGAEEANRESSAAGTSRDLHEMKDRLRRMETRLVKLFEHLGFDTERKKPTWRDFKLEVPSMQVSLEDMLGAVPPTVERHSYIEVMHKGKSVATLYYAP